MNNAERINKIIYIGIILKDVFTINMGINNICVRYNS